MRILFLQSPHTFWSRYISKLYIDQWIYNLFMFLEGQERIKKYSLVVNDREKLLKFEAESREFSKFLRSLEQFILTVGQNNFW